jgi:hypothetical protein
MKDFRAPNEHDAQLRTWSVVAAAYARRTPVRRPRRVPVRAVLVLALVAALTAVAFTPPGHAVLNSVRKAIAVEHAQPALYKLPAAGRILAGAWIVNANGSTRHLGDYAETSWSPFGRFIVGARTNALVALEPNGNVHWTLARPDVRFPRWAGTHTDTRIAYLSGDRLHVVGGDSRGDRELGPAAAAPVAPAWRQASEPLELAYADLRGHVWALVPDTGHVVFRTPVGARPRRLQWSKDGSRLLVVRARALDVYDARGRRVSHRVGRFVDAAFVGDSIAALSPHAVTLGTRVLFRTTGRLGRVVPSPDGRWLLVTWPVADEWLFVPTSKGRRLRAVANIAEQLGGASQPEGWTS